MAEDGSRTTANHEQAHESRHQAPAPAGPALGFLERDPTPALPGSILGDPRLTGRGNGPVRQALYLQMQRSHGNRAVQRSLQRRAGVPAGQDDFFHADAEQAADSAPHEQSKTVQRATAPIATVQRQPAADPTKSSITDGYARGLNDAQLEAETNRVRTALGKTAMVDTTYQTLYDNVGILENEVLRRNEEKLHKQSPDVDPNSTPFRNYCSAREDLQSRGQSLPEEPEAVAIPQNQLLVADESGQLQYIPAAQAVGIGDDLIPVLDGFFAAAQGGAPPSAGGVQEAAILWPDGRAVLSGATNADLLTMLIQGHPAHYDGITAVTGLGQPWKKAADGGGGMLRSGVYLLDTYPITNFRGKALPPGSRLRWANPTWRGQETHLVEVFVPGTKKFYAWDAHAPVGNTPHDFYHINHKGMHNVFGETNHASIPAAELGAAKSLRYVKIGGKVFLVVGVLIDSVQMGMAIGKSVEQGSARPAAAQAVRIIGGWGGAWAGAKLGCAAGAAAGIETGPGLVVTCIVGSAAGAFLGYLGSEWIADMIED